MLCSEKTYTTYVRSAHCAPSILGELVLQTLASCKTGEPADVPYKRVPPASSPPSLDLVATEIGVATPISSASVTPPLSAVAIIHPRHLPKSVLHKTLRIRNMKQAGEGYSSNFDQTIRANITFRESTVHCKYSSRLRFC